MSRIPKVEGAKYNNNSAFSWVDSQWEKFMNRQKELEERIKKLEEENRNLKRYFNIDSDDEDSTQLELF